MIKKFIQIFLGLMTVLILPALPYTVYSPNTADVKTAGTSGLPRTDVIDLSSHNGSVTESNFTIMKNYGVSKVIVKLTEGQTYVNPLASKQIINARAAGMTVGVYDYTHYATKQEAIAEATKFAKEVANLGLAKSTLLINDLEDVDTTALTNKTDTVTSLATVYYETLNKLGYTNQAIYTGSNYVSENDLNFNFIGNKRVWIAEYPTTPSSSNLLHQQYGMWQWSSKVEFPKVYQAADNDQGGVTAVFDASIDYGLFTAAKKTYPITIKMVNAKTNAVLSTTTKSYLAGQVITLPTIVGYATPTSNTLSAPAQTKTYTVKYTPNTYTTTYKYVNAKTGKTLKTTTSKYYAGQQNVKTPLPAIKNYTAPTASTFTAPNKNITRTVKYVPKAYQVTLKYIDSQTGKVIKKTTTSNAYYQTPFNTPIATISGYTAPNATTNNMTKNTTLTLKYTPKKYLVTVKYVNAKTGKTIKTATKQQVTYNKTYQPSVPAIKGYTSPKTTAIKVTHNVTLTLKYVKK